MERSDSLVDIIKKSSIKKNNLKEQSHFEIQSNWKKPWFSLPSGFILYESHTCFQITGSGWPSCKKYQKAKSDPDFLAKTLDKALDQRAGASNAKNGKYLTFRENKVWISDQNRSSIKAKDLYYYNVFISLI